MNLTTFLASTCISSPVWGFLQVLALLFVTSNFPNPKKEISSPLTNTSSIASITVSNFLSTSAFEENSPLVINNSMNSFLVII